MSIQDIAWALKQDVRPAAAKLLLIALANYTNERHECWPSKARLAKDCSMDKSNICKYLNQLEEIGLITVVKRAEDGAYIASLIRIHAGAEQIETASGTNTLGSGTGATRGSGTGATGVVVQARQRTVTEPSIEPSHMFDEFWKAYPKRDGANPKATAMKAWSKALKGAEAIDIVNATKAYAKQCEKKEIVGTPFVPMASTWLNQERWADINDGGANALTDERRKELERILYG